MEKRKDPRFPFMMPVTFRPAGDDGRFESLEERRSTEKKGKTLDVSLGGVFITTEQPLTVGNFLRVTLYLPDPSVAMTVFSDVVWEDGSGAGLHFVMIKNEDRQILEEFLKNLRRPTEVGR